MPAINFFYSIPYIFIIFALFACSIPINTATNQTGISNTYLQCVFSGFLLLFFYGLRGFIFTDWVTYYDCFQNAPTIWNGVAIVKKFLTHSNYSSWEKGFLLANVISKSIVNSWYFFQFVSYLFDFCVVYTFLKTTVPKHIVLGLCFYYIFGSHVIEINLLRNSKSIMLFICSLKYIRERKPIPFFLINLLASLFHATAVIYLPLYFILNKKFNKKTLFVIWIIGNLIYLLQISWSSVLVSKIAELIGGRLAGQAVYYLASKHFSVSNGLTIGYIERTFTAALVFKYYNRLERKNENIILVNCIFIYFFIYLYFHDMSILTDRLPVLFIFAYWVLYPEIYEFQNKQNKGIFLSLFLLYSLIKMTTYKTIACVYDNYFFQLYDLEQRKKMLHIFNTIK